jgi:predicted phage terminase large subunit-like protein
MKNPTWAHLLFKAHRGIDDFEDILWPEKFPEKRLRAIKESFIKEGDSAGYSQEYLNDPFDLEDAFLRRQDFIAMTEDDYDTFKENNAGVDFAVSKADKANRTSFTIGGLDAANLLHVVDQRKGRWNATEIVDMFFIVQKRWSIDTFFVEDGVIWKALRPMLEREMGERNIWMSVHPLPSVKDKKTRGRSLQKRHRNGGMRFDKKGEWYEDYEAELLRFTGDSEALLDDQFDSTVELCRGVENRTVDEEDSMTEEERDWMRESESLRGGNDGRNATCGY